MKLSKPAWVHYDDKPIFSVDVHPMGEKFATGGQGNDVGRVVIWNLAPVLSEKDEHNRSVPKILCQMDNHLACVNCVRWSICGSMLASGGDDKVVIIWKIGSGPSGVFGSGGMTKNAENWRSVATLRGHSGDVLDLAWSPQGRWLASCSVDNNIIVWDVLNMPQISAILKGHTGLVKGVSWDPVGKFLASQSDDKSIKIWKTSDWTSLTNITEPFEDCGGTTHILRLSWSPDGQYLVSAHAMNGGGATANIIEREGWKRDKDFVGHRKAVTCVRFHNSILKRSTPKANKQYCCCAVGSRDRSLSVWVTALQRPIVVIHDLFKDSVLDLSWSTLENILLACSTDGTLACLQFSPDELGVPLSVEDKNALYQRMYGKGINSDLNTQSGKELIIEDASLLTALKENKKEEPVLPSSASIQMPPPPLPRPLPSDSQSMQITSPAKAIQKQIETRTADGKRRITPVFIPNNEEDNIASEPQFQSSSRNITSILSDTESISQPPNSVAAVQTTNTAATTVSTVEERASIAVGNFDFNAERPSKLSLDNRLTKAGPSVPIKAQIITEDNTTSEKQCPQSSNMEAIRFARLNRLNAGKAAPLKGIYAKSINDVRLQVHNDGTASSYGKLSKVACSPVAQKDKTLWDVYLGSPISIFTVCPKYSLLCSMDGTLRFLELHTGILLLPVLHMPTAAVQCAFSSDSLLGGVITECGLVRIWNMTEKSVSITSTCSDVLKGGFVIQFFITESGAPFIILSNGTSYSYCKKLESWVVVNSKDPIVRHGLNTSSKTFQKNLKNYPLSSVQSSMYSQQNSARTFSSMSCNTWEHAAKLHFIENQIQICFSINSPLELRYWYSMLGYHLAHFGTESRLRLLLDDLLGPAHEFADQSKNSILGIAKHTLLADALEHIKQQAQWQRIYLEYTEQLISSGST